MMRQHLSKVKSIKHSLILAAVMVMAFLQSCSITRTNPVSQEIGNLFNGEEAYLEVWQGRSIEKPFTCYPSTKELNQLSKLISGYHLEKKPAKWEVLGDLGIKRKAKMEYLRFYLVFHRPENIAFKIGKRYYCGKNLSEVEKLFLSMSRTRSDKKIGGHEDGGNE